MVFLLLRSVAFRPYHLAFSSNHIHCSCNFSIGTDDNRSLRSMKGQPCWPVSLVYYVLRQGLALSARLRARPHLVREGNVAIERWARKKDASHRARALHHRRDKRSGLLITLMIPDWQWADRRRGIWTSLPRNMNSLSCRQKTLGDQCADRKACRG